MQARVVPIRFFCNNSGCAPFGPALAVDELSSLDRAGAGSNSEYFLGAILACYQVSLSRRGSFCSGCRCERPLWFVVTRDSSQVQELRSCPSGSWFIGKTICHHPTSAAVRRPLGHFHPPCLCHKTMARDCGLVPRHVQFLRDTAPELQEITLSDVQAQYEQVDFFIIGRVPPCNCICQH